MAAYAAVGIAAVGTTIAIVSAIKHGEAAKESGEENAKAAEDNAAAAKKSYIADEQAFRIQARKQLGDIKAGYAASGVTLEGSPMDIINESAQAMEHDALKIREEGDNRAAAFSRDAQIARARGQRGQDSGYWSAAGALASGAGKMYNSYSGDV